MTDILTGVVSAVWGPPKNGKTLFCVADFHAALLAGWTCYHNFDLRDSFERWRIANRIPVERVVYVNWGALGAHGFADWFLSDSGPRGVRFYFDDCAIYFPMLEQDQHACLDQIFSRLAHYGCSAVLNSQTLGKISKRVRDNINYNYECINLSQRRVGGGRIPGWGSIIVRERDRCVETGRPNWQRAIPISGPVIQNYWCLVDTVSPGQLTPAQREALIPRVVRGLPWAYASIFLSVSLLALVGYQGCSRRRQIEQIETRLRQAAVAPRSSAGSPLPAPSSAVQKFLDGGGTVAPSILNPVGPGTGTTSAGLQPVPAGLGSQPPATPAPARVVGTAWPMQRAPAPWWLERWEQMRHERLAKPVVGTEDRK